ncbi:MAG: hypothetical protein ACHP7E_04590 [Burkholderiales bacterium]
MNPLNELARTLRALHARLLQCARAQYLREHADAGEIGTGEMLMLATQHEEFAWLRSLSELMAEVDELREDLPATQAASLQAAVRGAVDELLATHSRAATPFQVRYWQYVHEDPEVAMAHAGLRQALQGLPAPAAGGRDAMSLHLQSRTPRSPVRK